MFTLRLGGPSSCQTRSVLVLQIRILLVDSSVINQRHLPSFRITKSSLFAPKPKKPFFTFLATLKPNWNSSTSVPFVVYILGRRDETKRSLIYNLYPIEQRDKQISFCFNDDRSLADIRHSIASYSNRLACYQLSMTAWTCDRSGKSHKDTSSSMSQEITGISDANRLYSMQHIKVHQRLHNKFHKTNDNEAFAFRAELNKSCRNDEIGTSTESCAAQNLTSLSPSLVLLTKQRRLFAERRADSEEKKFSCETLQNI